VLVYDLAVVLEVRVDRHVRWFASSGINLLPGTDRTATGHARFRAIGVHGTATPNPPVRLDLRLDQVHESFKREQEHRATR